MILIPSAALFNETKILTMTSVTPLPRASLSQQIRDQLLDRIMRGELQPGSRLIELRIAAEFSTSQAPVREALRELEAMGVVQTLPNKGARVRTITNEELRQLYDVRAQLEAYAAQLATELGAQLKSRLKETVTSMRKSARESDSTGFASHNSRFHRIIVESSGNKVLLELWETLNVQTRTMTNVTRTRRNLMDLADSHLEIIDAIASGKPEKANLAAKDHVLSNRPDASE